MGKKPSTKKSTSQNRCKGKGAVGVRNLAYNWQPFCIFRMQLPTDQSVIAITVCDIIFVALHFCNENAIGTSICHF
ncbi:unnamed protein product [Prunus brigantina]